MIAAHCLALSTSFKKPLLFLRFFLSIPSSVYLVLLSLPPFVSPVLLFSLLRFSFSPFLSFVSLVLLFSPFLRFPCSSFPFRLRFPQLLLSLPSSVSPVPPFPSFFLLRPSYEDIRPRDSELPIPTTSNVVLR